jgi:hypothetical protein
MHKKILFVTMMVLLAGFLAPSCKISYSFTGANISPDVKTFTVYYFPNRAQLVNPTLSQSFTEALREKLQRQTSLNELGENGDLLFEGEITGYDYRPMAIQEQDQAALSRLTVRVKVKYTNNVDPEQNMEQTFSAYEDFDNTLSLTAAEDEIVPQIIEKLNEDIFNATIANW